jgi:hypothetical protein
MCPLSETSNGWTPVVRACASKRESGDIEGVIRVNDCIENVEVPQLNYAGQRWSAAPLFDALMRPLPRSSATNAFTAEDAAL